MKHCQVRLVCTQLLCEDATLALLNALPIDLQCLIIRPRLTEVVHHLDQRGQVVQSWLRGRVPGQLQVIVLDALVRFLLLGAVAGGQEGQVVAAHQRVGGVVAAPRVVAQDAVP